MRLIQGKDEAKLFYAFLSKVYDHIVNPGHWTEDMRTEALKPLKLSPGQTVYDVGGGTGFCTLGVIASGVSPSDITLVDQSVGQMEKARRKEALRGVNFVEGDAENLDSLPSDSADRYVSAGSIEYWPNPQRGICEAFRVVKPGGRACVIGPVAPTYALSSFFANLWMLFPTELEYVEWFTRAGFSDVRLTRIGPSWYEGERGHGLIMGCSVTGVKPAEVLGPSPGLGAMLEEEAKSSEAGSDAAKKGSMSVVIRSLVGSIGGLFYFFLPIYMWVKYQLKQKGLLRRSSW